MENDLRHSFKPVVDILIMQVKAFCILVASVVLNILGFLLIGNIGIFLIAGGWYCLYLVYKLVKDIPFTPIQTTKNLFNAIKNLLNTPRTMD